MTPVTCRYCGLPFKVRQVEPDRDYFCCTGCALLARVSETELNRKPITGPAAILWLAGFLYFNQLLFSLLVVLLTSRSGENALSARLEVFVVIAAFSVWGSVVYALYRGRAARLGDWFVAGLALSSLLFAFLNRTPAIGGMAAVNAILLIWNVRGVFRGQRVKR